MAYPSVTPLPATPSRVGDPDNFGGEAQVFLAAFTTWRTQSNSFASYLNTLPFNQYNWGTLVQVNPAHVPAAEIPARPSVAMPGLAFASAADTVWMGLQSLSVMQNSLGAYADILSGFSEAMAFVADVTRPAIGLLTTNPARGQSQSVFNSNSTAFYESVAVYAQSADALSSWFYEIISPDNYGLIGDPITLSEDWGTL